MLQVLSKWNRLKIRRLMWKVLVRNYHLNHSKITIDLTYICDLGCVNCNRSCRQAPSDEQMAVEQIQRFIDESVNQNRKWKQISLEGGEPTLHPQILEIVRALLEFKKGFSPGTNIVLATNGYGLRAKETVSVLSGDITVHNSKKKSVIRSEFDAFNIAPLDLAKYRRHKFLNGCYIPSFYGIGLTRFGYYPCSIAGGIDRVFGLDLGLKQLPRPGDQMLHLRQAFCRFCGHYIRFNKAGGREQVSQSWKDAYEKYRTTKPELTAY